MLSRFVIAFRPVSKHLNFIATVTVTVILEPKEVKSVIFSLICLPWSDGTGYHDLNFLNVEF